MREVSVKKLRYTLDFFLICQSYKSFFGFHKYSSVTGMLLTLGLPGFTTLMHNCRAGFTSRIVDCSNV